MSHDSDGVWRNYPGAFGDSAATGRPGVLIVDDELQLVTAISDALDDDYRVIGETSAARALEILEQDHGIQVIISDQRMPQMNGDEFLARAREISSATRILITAYADLGAVIDAVNNGKIFSYLRKPWDDTALRSVVDAGAYHFAVSAALQQERALLNCILDCSVDAISVKDAVHRYIRLNKAEVAMLGIDSTDEANGKSHSAFLEGARATCWDEEEDRLLETFDPIRDRVEQVSDENGCERWYSTNKAPIRNAAGEALGFVSVTRDVTESKLIEQLKDDFISTARHELRTPLTVIMSSVQLLRAGVLGKLPPKAMDQLRQSEVNCQRLLTLITNMLETQDFMLGKAGLELTDVGLYEVINEALVEIEPLRLKYEIDISMDAVPPSSNVRADRKRLVQILTNLLSNACKFSPEHSAVRIAVSQTPDDVSISIFDQGPGIPSAFTGQIFKSFTQADNSGTRTHDGAGLGLRVCKAIAEAHGGQIGFRNNTDVGSEFFVTLPRNAANLEFDDLPAGPGSAARVRVSPECRAATAERTEKPDMQNS